MARPSVRPVVWTDEARRNLMEIVEYIAQENPIAARQVADGIVGSAKLLEDLATGHPGRVSGTYEKVVPDLPYILAYAIGQDPSKGESIVILRLIHTARLWVPGGWPQ